MCTVKELKDFLEAFPEDAIVEVGREYFIGWEAQIEFAPVDLAYGNCGSSARGGVCYLRLEA